MLMVLLDENLDATEIYEADRKPVIAALTAPGSKARNERGALAVSKFKSIGRLVWGDRVWKRSPAPPCDQLARPKTPDISLVDIVRYLVHSF